MDLYLGLWALNGYRSAQDAEQVPKPTAGNAEAQIHKLIGHSLRRR